MPEIPIALLNIPVDAGDKKSNRERIAYYAKQAARDGMKYVFAPELALTGYAIREWVNYRSSEANEEAQT